LKIIDEQGKPHERVVASRGGGEEDEEHDDDDDKTPHIEE
jgi:hypothetical protein